MTAPAGTAGRRGAAAGSGVPGDTGRAGLARGSRGRGVRRGAPRAGRAGPEPVPAAGLTAPERL